MITERILSWMPGFRQGLGFRVQGLGLGGYRAFKGLEGSGLGAIRDFCFNSFRGLIDSDFCLRKQHHHVRAG